MLKLDGVEIAPLTCIAEFGERPRGESVTVYLKWAPTTPPVQGSECRIVDIDGTILYTGTIAGSEQCDEITHVHIDELRPAGKA